MTTSEIITEFRDSVTPDLYDANHYIAWASIEEGIARCLPAVDFLEGTRCNLTARVLADGLLKEPTLYEVATTLLAIPRGAGFSDGRELPDPATPVRSDFEVIAQLLLDVGLLKLLEGASDIKALLRVGFTAQDSARRRYRVGSSIDERIRTAVDEALWSANEAGASLFTRVPQRQWPANCRGRVDYVISVNGLPRIAIDSVFQTASGGRQLRDLSTTYPRLQQEITETGLSLILIADGRGIREAGNDILTQLFEGVASCLTLRQAASGALLRDFVRFSESQAPTSKSRSLQVLIENALASVGVIYADELPVVLDQARLALADYLDRHRDLDLVLESGGIALSWRRRELVGTAFRLQHKFTPAVAVNYFTEAMNVSSVGSFVTEQLHCSMVELKVRSPVIPKTFLVAGLPTMPNRETLQEVSTIALSKVPDSTMSVVLCPDPPDEETATDWRRLQETMATNVIVLDATHLLELARSNQSPSALLAAELLKQSDLVKTSPFVLSSVTPDRMFYGRESEEATMLSTLKSNSIALVGGRRIGKTSLMRHAEDRLRDAGFTTYFGDCQTVRDWSGFAKMAARWGKHIPETFEPSGLIELVKSLQPNPESKLVLLLDEIDQLLDWDESHAGSQVPESFFRACRTLSQESHAQFVFSGERVIANRLWDAHSPHWNFTHPLELRQLDKLAARKLLFSPLEALQVSISEEKSVFDVAWSRTNGHPQLLQTLGDGLIRVLNNRLPALRSNLTPADLIEVTDTYTFAEHYIETYWGQATILERLITLLIARQINSLKDVRDFLAQHGVERNEAEVRSALRILQMYGITDSTDTGYEMRLDWFSTAIAFYGSSDELIDQYITSLL